MKKRTALLKPLHPYYKHFGTKQSWRMFIAPHRFPSRLTIDVSTSADRRTAEWEPLYRARDPDLNWHAHQLDHDRMRAAVFRYGWKHYRGSYKEFATWIARQVAVDRPEANWVRVRLYRYETPSPQQVREERQPTGEYHSTLHLDLREHR